MTRKVKIYTTAGMPGTIETNVATLGQLKPLLAQREINYSGMKMLVGETKNELSMDDAILPEGDFKLYLMPEKTKSGVDLDEMENTLDNTCAAVYRIDEKLNTVISKLDSMAKAVSAASSAASHTMMPTTSHPTISAEDQREIDELKKLAGLATRNEWD